MYIYKIYHPETGKCYIGSTSLAVRQRFSLHKSRAKAPTRSAFHREMFAAGVESWQCEVLEIVPPCPRGELYRKEQAHLDATPKEHLLNKKRAVKV